MQLRASASTLPCLFYLPGSNFCLYTVNSTVHLPTKYLVTCLACCLSLSSRTCSLLWQNHLICVPTYGPEQCWHRLRAPQVFNGNLYSHSLFSGPTDGLLVLPLTDRSPGSPSPFTLLFLQWCLLSHYFPSLSLCNWHINCPYPTYFSGLLCPLSSSTALTQRLLQVPDTA